MKIYIGHSKQLNYQKELYQPIRESLLSQKHQIVLPHEKSDLPFNSKQYLKTCDVMVAEISYPTISLGIEIGWADSFGCKIIFVYKKGTEISNSLKIVSNTFIEYKDTNDLVKKLSKALIIIKR